MNVVLYILCLRTWTGIRHQIGKGCPQKVQILNTYNSPDRTKGDYSKTKQ